ncbi:MAG: hypothetical protein WC755_08630 [Candidatus Woesearchaeota archaeon]|jgi:hypothetical protein
MKSNIKRKYGFRAVVNGEEIFPKGFYYQGNFIILVGDEKRGDTIRRKEKISDVEIIVTEET